jgi:replicative DNA helicase
MNDRQQALSADPSIHQLPPQNIEAEESLLSAILIDNQTLYEIVDIITAEDFYKTAHQKIFMAVAELFSAGEPVDLVTLSNKLKNRGDLEAVGGAVYLAQLVDSIPLAVNAPHYARIIRDNSCLRKLIEKANLIMRKCMASRGPVDDLIDEAESAIFEIAENKIQPAFSHIRDIIDDNFDVLEERQNNKTLVTGVATGYRYLDTLTSGFQNSDLIILAARPSMGKTALALNLARNAAVDSEIPVAIFSLEMSKEQLSMRMLCAEARVDSSRLRSGFLNRDDWTKLTDAAGVLSKAPLFIDDSPDITVMSIRAKARRLKKEQNIGLLFIDYLQLMKGNASAERRDLEISEISRSLKGLAKELSLPIIALSQLNRKLEERSDKRPQLSDLRESGALEQDADIVAFIYRDEVYNKDENSPNKGKAELIVSKQRNGPTGVVHLTFLNACTRFEDQASEDLMGDYRPDA